MYIKNLKVKNFRSYDSCDISFSDSKNIIYGDNAAGKTNLLEAVFVFCTGRSHRRATDAEMIKDGEKFSVIEIGFTDGVRDYKGKMILSPDRRKSVTINDMPIEKISRISGYINAVMFSPEDLCIIKDAPSDRRRFLDMAISQIRPGYVNALNDYLKILKQRNNLLKKEKDEKKLEEMLFVWDEALCAAASSVLIYRSEFIKFTEPFVKKFYNELSGEELSVCYESSISEDISDKEIIEKSFREKLLRARRRDIETAVTNYGVHRDDIRFYINGKEAKIFASQGQQRSIILCLKLAQTEAVKEVKGTYPVILLDDIMSELDRGRREYFASKITDKQVIITCTDKKNAAAKYFHVKDKKVWEE